MVPALAQVYDHLDFPETGTRGWWFSMTPIHAIWAGQEAVYLFFVLSGLVLTLAVMKQSSFDWMSYYPRRMIRLYIPVWVAVGVAALSMALVPRNGEEQASTWLARRADNYDAGNLRIDLTLLWGGGGFGLSPLWSLRWEVLFSILLPLFVIFAVKARKLWALKIAVILLIAAVGAHKGWAEFRYLPMFAVGALIAAHWDSISAAMTAAFARRFVGLLTFCAAILLFTMRWWGLALGVPVEKVNWLGIGALGGATLLVLLASHWPVARAFLEWRPVHWLGLISFSLYLVHESVIITVRYLLIDYSMAVVALIAFPLSILCAWVFHRLVELPTYRLARKVGQRVHDEAKASAAAHAR